MGRGVFLLADPGCQVPATRPIGLYRQDLSEINKLDIAAKNKRDA
jgi:hypothetical protein